jgi:DNA-binding NtrC family response regulator
MENVIMQGILFSTGNTIRPENVNLKRESSPRPGLDVPVQALSYREAKEQTLQQFNHRYLSNLLKDHQGNVSKAARHCGLERQALQQIMRRYGIKAAPFRQ